MCTGKTPAEGCILAVDEGGVARLRVTTPLGRALARLGVRRDGLVVYRVKNAGRGRVKQRVMSPVGCLARLAAMVPPPR